MPGGGHLQTSLWAQIKAQAGWQAVRLCLSREGAIEGGCQLFVRRGRLGAIAYCPRGPLARDRDPAVIATVLDALMELGRRERILYLKVQPPPGGEQTEALLLGRGFVRSALAAAHAATVRVDVQRAPAEILGGMPARRRSYIRRAERDGYPVVHAAGVDQMPKFGRLLEQTRARKGPRFSAYPPAIYERMMELFGDRALLLIAEHEGKALAASFVIGYGDTAVLLMKAWSGRDGALHPNELLDWRGMMWARDHGYRYYDLDGITEAAARAKLAGTAPHERVRSGTTAYKLGMGGEVTLYPRAYDRSFQPLLVWPTRLLAPHLDVGGLKAIRRLRGRGVRDSRG